MKRLFFRCIAGCLLAPACVAEAESHLFEGDFTNGIRMELSIKGNTGLPTTAQQVWYQFISKSNVVRMFVPKPTYLCQIDLIDASGKSVSKTSLGKRFGAKFNQPVQFDWDSKWKSMDRDKDGMAKRVFAGPQGGGSLNIPPCDELFQLKEPGVYTFRVQFQAYQEINFREQHRREIRLVQFPRFEIKMRKP